MAIHRVLTEFGMGISLRRQDYAQAARRALLDAPWHNSINIAELFGFAKLPSSPLPRSRHFCQARTENGHAPECT